MLVLISFTIVSCEQDLKKYAVISHTRLNDNTGVNKAVSKLSLKQFDVVMLGGDMANLSSYNDTILNYLDSVFNVSSLKTLWALGNHDYSNVELLKSFTQKPSYYYIVRIIRCLLF